MINPGVLMTDLFNEESILKKLNVEDALPNVDRFLEYNTKHQIDLLSTISIKNIDSIFLKIIGQKRKSLDQNDFEQLLKIFLNSRGVVGYNIIKSILLNQNLNNEILMFFVNSKIKRISHFNKYILLNEHTRNEIIEKICIKTHAEGKIENKLKVFRKIDFRNERDLNFVLKSMTLKEYFKNLKNSEKELFISYVSLNKNITPKMVKDISETVGSDSRWVRHLLFQLKVNNEKVITEDVISYLLTNNNINNLEPIYCLIPITMLDENIITQIKTSKTLVAVIKIMTLDLFRKVNKNEVMGSVEDILYILQEMEYIEEEALLEILRELGKKIENNHCIEPDMVFGKCVMTERVIQMLYSLNVKKVDSYLVNCMLTSDNILVKLLKRYPDKEKIAENIKDEKMKETLRRILL